MYPDYHLAVWQAYQEMKAQGQLSPNLRSLKRAKLRDECILALNRRYREGLDDYALSGYFDPQNDEDGYRVQIRKKGADRFKTLENLLKSDLGNIGDEHIEMLAFLIDFKPRPGHFWEKKAHEDAPLSDLMPTGGTTPTVITDVTPPVSDEIVTPKNTRWLITTLCLFLACSFGVLIYRNYGKRTAVDTGTKFVVNQPKGKCMYWAGDHYSAGLCNVLHGDTPTVQLDSFKLVNFKKINNWSTLNSSAIGKVWWARKNKNLELYSVEGFHPIDTNRGLRPLSDYMFNEYIKPFLK